MTLVDGFLMIAMLVVFIGALTIYALLEKYWSNYGRTKAKTRKTKKTKDGRSQ